MCALMRRRRANFNPRSLHGERPDSLGEQRDCGISIHAPCTGSDFSTTIVPSSWVYFNPRSLHGERHQQTATGADRLPFQSTLPARGATSVADEQLSPYAYFNPRSLHGERLCRSCTSTVRTLFQSTLPARGATPGHRCCSCFTARFQSTLPARGATITGRAM